MADEPLLRVQGLTKTFPGLRALDDIALQVHPGEIVAVVGQNGSGKSTLVKILAGLYAADSGTVEVRAADGTMLTGAAAHQELHFIHQDLGLIPMLTTVENLDLGQNYGSRALTPTSPRAEADHARALVARFGASFDVDVPVSELSAAERAIVAIARALDGWKRGDHVLVLDEPTTALHGDEVGRLFTAVRTVAAAGAGVIFISHRLDEVMDLADRVVALRDGRVVADVADGAYDQEQLVQMIAGREVSQARVAREGARDEAAILQVRGLGGHTVAAFDLDLRPGEIVGVSGILGSGREDLAGLLFGALRRERGEVTLAGEALAPGSTAVAITRGVAFVPADRRAEGAVMDMCVRENITLPRLRSLRRRFFRLDGRQEREETDRWMAHVDLRPPMPERPLKLFSGGNQQKVVLAKWLRNEPRLLLLDEPTQGVDVGAKASIYELVVRAADAGAAVLLCSTDTKELTMLCDRVLVLRDGRTAAELSGATLTEAHLVRESLGLRATDAERLFGEGIETHA